MDLPNLLAKIKPGSDVGKKFLAIEIATHAVKTAVWQVREKHTEIVAMGSIQAWETVDGDDLLTAIDTSLAEALAGISDEPDEVIFGLPETWVGEENIAENKKQILKTVCQKLGLKPVGFVVTTEAVVHYLQDTEGGAPSAILIQVSTDQVMVSLVEQGRLQGVQVVSRSGKIGLDVQEGLARFGVEEGLPNRMILYDSKEDLEGMKQELIGFDWQAKLPFLHFPQIEILPKDNTIKAVALSGGAEVAKSLGIHLMSQAANQEPAATPMFDEPEAKADEGELPPNMMNEFGFNEVDIDMTKENNAGELEQELGEESAEVVDQEEILPIQTEMKMSEDALTQKKVGLYGVGSMGLDRDQDQDREGWPQESEVVEVNEEEVFFQKAPEEELTVKAPEPEKKKKGIRLALPWKRKPKVKTWANEPKLRKIKTPSLLVLGLLVLVVLIVGGGIFYWQVPTAEMTIYLTPQSLDKELTFTLDANATEVNMETKTIPVEQSTVEISGTQQTPTTGSKTVGERAKGQVEIFNLQRSPAVLEAGTVVKSGSLAFTINEGVNLASASAQQNPDFSVVIKPSSAKVAATAADIGQQYNIADGMQLTVANFSQAEMAAKTVGSFTGGTSQQIQAVAEADKDRVTEELMKQLNQQIEVEVSEKTAGQKGVIPAGEPEVVEEEYSAEVGEEASSLSLTATMNQEIYMYEKKDVSLLGQQQVLAEIPQGFEMMAAATGIEVVDSTVNEDGTVSITARVSIKLLPSIDTQAIAVELSGKYPPETQEYLRTLPSYKSADVVIKPSLPARLNTFPRRVENIKITVEGQQ